MVKTDPPAGAKSSTATPPSPLVNAVSARPCAFSVATARQLLSANGWNVVPGGQTTCVKPGTRPGECGAGIRAREGISLNVDYVSGVPSLHDEMKDLAARAKTCKLKLDEFQGGGFTISNLGMFGVKEFAAIINPPQSLIVSVGTIVKKPVVDAGGAVRAGQRMTVGISCDHRVVDGAIGAQFLAELKKLLENPVWLLV